MEKNKDFNNFVKETLITDAIETECQTPDTKYKIKIKDKYVLVKIELPKELDLSDKEAELLEYNIHNSMELVFSKYFK